MRIVKTLELNEDQMYLLVLNGMGMTKQEICDATGRGESDVTASITEALTGWKTEIIAFDKDEEAFDKDEETPLPETKLGYPLPESRTLNELRAEWGSAVPADAKLVDNREFLRTAYPGRRAYTRKANGIPVTDDQYQIWKLSKEGLTVGEIAEKMGKSPGNISASIGRLEKRGLKLNILQAKKGPPPMSAPYRKTKEGINISRLEHNFARLYAKGEHNLAQMADALDVKLQAIHDVKYRLKNKLAIRDDIEFNYALRAIAEL